MKNSIYFLTFLSFLSLIFSSASSSVNEKENRFVDKVNNIETGYKNMAVLELFTSQGCSSCPPADRLMREYQSKENVIVLSFHVDYWNRLGWKDPYSSKEYSQRQYKYASALNAQVYTPQLVINGQIEMIGSDADKISAIIKKAITQQTDASLLIKTVNPENGQLNVNFVASGNTLNSFLNIAIVEKKTTTQIKAGENDGITLNNYNVVRNFETNKQVNNGENIATINIPAQSDLKKMSVILFLQQNNSNKIIAAATVDL
ncbi:MAG: DUF1223 domain-containing protein [Bacteroidota bacterium]|nr:DUF1223 domain-containing protein [Bacteroidota bacterium]